MAVAFGLLGAFGVGVVVGVKFAMLGVENIFHDEIQQRRQGRS